MKVTFSGDEANSMLELEKEGSFFSSLGSDWGSLPELVALAE